MGICPHTAGKWYMIQSLGHAILFQYSEGYDHRQSPGYNGFEINASLCGHALILEGLFSGRRVIKKKSEH
jgi:hypothetical protein